MTTRVCSFCNERPLHAKGLCHVCYSRQYRHGSPDYKRVKNAEKTCKFEGCEDTRKSRGYCNAHYMRLSRQDPALVGLTLKPCSIEGCTEQTWHSICEPHRLARKAERQRLIRANRPKTPPKPRKNYADLVGIRHLANKKPIPDDFWEFVKYELGIDE